MGVVECCAMLCAYSLTLATVFAFNGRPTTRNFGTMLSLAGCQEMTETNELASAVTMAMSGNRNTCAALWCTPSSLDPPKMTGKRCSVLQAVGFSY